MEIARTLNPTRIARPAQVATRTVTTTAIKHPGGRISDWLTFDTKALVISLASETNRSVSEVITLAVNLFKIGIRDPTLSPALQRRIAKKAPHGK